MNTEIEERRSALDDFANMSGEPRRTESQQMQVVNPGSGVPLEERRRMANLYKRNKGMIIQEIRQMAAAAGNDWYYRIPFKNRKENRTDWVEGPSIKCANAVAQIFGNCDIDCRVYDHGEYWLFYAKFEDDETGFRLTRPFQQRKDAAKMGGDDQGRKLEIALSIGASKAERNVITNALQFYTDIAFEEAKQALVDRIGKELPKYRDRTIERVSTLCAIERVEAVIGKKAAEWVAPDVARVIAMAKSVTDGMAHINDTFPPLDLADTTAETTSALDRFAGDGESRGSTDRDEADHSEQAPPLRGSVAGQDPDGAGDGVPSPSPAQIVDRLRDQLATVTDEAAMQEIWDGLDIDGRFADDRIMLDRAKKVLGARKKELRS